MEGRKSVVIIHCLIENVIEIINVLFVLLKHALTELQKIKKFIKIKN